MTPEEFRIWRRAVGARSQTAAGALLGYSRPVVARWEGGAQPIPHAVALACAALAAGLGPWKPQSPLQGNETMAAFTVKSWNNTNPEDFAAIAGAEARAIGRAQSEGALVKLRDNETGYVRTYSAAHGWSKWQDDSAFSAKDDAREAAAEAGAG